MPSPPCKRIGGAERSKEKWGDTNLGGDDQVIALPAKLLDGLTHNLLALTWLHDEIS